MLYSKFEHPADQKTLCCKEADKVKSYLEELCPSATIDEAKDAFKTACEQAGYDGNSWHMVINPACTNNRDADCSKDDDSSSTSSGKSTKKHQSTSAPYPSGSGYVRMTTVTGIFFANVPLQLDLRVWRIDWFRDRNSAYTYRNRGFPRRQRRCWCPGCWRDWLTHLSSNPRRHRRSYWRGAFCGCRQQKHGLRCSRSTGRCRCGCRIVGGWRNMADFAYDGSAYLNRLGLRLFISREKHS